jgi:hypothetical protein
MCYKLVQIYACDHSKAICTTPCPHALALSNTRNSTELPSILRSNPTAFSIVPSSRRNAAVDPLPSLADVPLMPEVTSLPGRSLQPDVSPLLDVPPRPAFRIMTDGSPATPFPAVPTSSHLDAAPLGHTVEAQSEQLVVQPAYCSYYFPHYLMRSLRPCRQCYLQPEWEGLRRVWVEKYRIDHHMG